MFLPVTCDVRLNAFQSLASWKPVIKDKKSRMKCSKSFHLFSFQRNSRYNDVSSTSWELSPNNKQTNKTSNTYIFPVRKCWLVKIQILRRTNSSDRSSQIQSRMAPNKTDSKVELSGRAMHLWICGSQQIIPTLIRSHNQPNLVIKTGKRENKSFHCTGIQLSSPAGFEEPWS